MAQLKAGWSRVPNPLIQAYKGFHLRPVKLLKFTFDPYHPNVRSMREALFLLRHIDIVKTNLNCVTKIDVKSDRSEPVIDIEFIDDHKLIFNTAHLSTLDIMEKFRELCEAKDPKKFEPVNVLAKKKEKKKKK